MEKPTSFFDPVNLGCTERECHTNKDIVDTYRSMFETRISAGVLEKPPSTGKLDANISHGLMTWKVMQRNAWKDIANLWTKQLNSYTKSQHHALTTTNSRTKKWDMLKTCLKFAHRLFWNACIWPVLVDLVFNCPWTKLTRAITPWTRACDERWFVWSHTFITH